MTTASVQTDGHLDGPHVSLPPTTQPSGAAASTSSSLPSPAHETSPDELSSLLFSGSSNSQLEDAFDLNQLDAAAFGSSGGKKRGRKLAPATGDKRREANRAAQRSFRERKVQHVKDLEMQVSTFEGQKRRVAHLIHGLVSENATLRQSLGQDPQSLQELLEQFQGFEIDFPKAPSNSSTLSSNYSGTTLSPSKSPRSLSERFSRSPSPQAELSSTSASTPLPSYPPPPPAAGAGASRASLSVPARQPPSHPPTQRAHMHIPAMPVIQPEFFMGDAPPRPQPVPNLHPGPAGPTPAVAGFSGDLSHVSSSSMWHPAMLPAGSFPHLGEPEQLNLSRHQRSPTFLPGLQQPRPQPQQQQHQNQLPPSLQFTSEPHPYPHHPWTGPP